MVQRWKALAWTALAWTAWTARTALAVSPVVSLRAVLQQRFGSRAEAVASMDTDSSGIVTNEEFERFMVRSLGRSEAEAAATLQALCPAVGQVRLTERQLDAMSFDLQLSALRLLLQAEYETSDQLMSFLDTSGDAQVSPGEWASGLSSHLISALNAQELFQRLDVGQMGFLVESSLRLLVRASHLALCDYRQLLVDDGDDGADAFFRALVAADDGEQKLQPEELVAQAELYCVGEAPARALHAELDVLSDGFVDLFALSAPRLPQLLLRGSLTAYRACLKSYFANDRSAAVQDLAVRAAGYPANSVALELQGALVAWQPAEAMRRLFGQLDPLSSGALPRQRFESVAGTVTLSGLRLFLAEVASDRPELLARADIDQGGSLSRAEFLSLTQLLGLTTLNGEELFGLLNYSSTELDQTLQVVLGDVTLVHLRLLALCEFGPDSALAPADEDASDTVDLQEFHHFAGGYLAVSNTSNVENLFIALDVSRGGALRPAQLALLTAQGTLDLALLRHLARVELQEDALTPLMDTSHNGLVDFQELRAWATQRLALGGGALAKVFYDLDVCQTGELQESQLRILIEPPTVVVLRRLLASRFPRAAAAAALAADSDGDGRLAEEEFALFMQDLFIGADDALALFRLLDFDQDGALNPSSELPVATEPTLPLFDFRRLAAWSFESMEEATNRTDVDGDGWVTEAELWHMGCRFLGLRGNATSATVFRAIDLSSTGQVAALDVGLALGSVSLFGFRSLAQSVFTAGVEAFLTFDLSGDGLLQMDEFLSLSAQLAIGRANAELLFQELATRSPDAVHQDVFLLAVNGLAQFRKLVRESYADVRSALLGFDTVQPWTEVSLEEFAAWCTRLQLPSSLVPELFEALDVRQEGKLLRSHFEMLLSGQLTARGLSQLLTSAFGFLQTAFEKADGEGDGNGVVDLPELARLATPLGVSSANVAQLFAELDQDQVGTLSLEQVMVMAPKGHALRLSNAQAELEHVHIYELRLFGDAECHLDRICELPISSGHFEAGPGANGSAAFTAGRAFDDRAETRWVSQCGPCREEVAWLGCKSDTAIEVRCLELLQTAPTRGEVPAASKVATAWRLQSWNGRAWETVADIVKPPLWEIDNFGEAFIFKLPFSETTSRPSAEPVDVDAEAFEDRFGMSLPILVLICVGVGICGLLCLCVLCPICARPSCLNALRINAPERMDAKRSKRLDKVLRMKQEVKALEASVQAGAMTTDEWGQWHKVQHREQKARERELDQMRKVQATLEASAKTPGGREAPSEERQEQRRMAMERFRRMKEAYESKTIAVDGVALQAPESVLLELGFEPEMIEAFGLPGFSSSQREGGLGDEEDEDLESKDSDSEQEEKEEESDEEEDLPVTTPSKFDDGRVTVPPQLDEAPALFKEGARLRRNAMAGLEEGQPMDAEELKRAQRKAALLKGSELVEDDDVEVWMSQRKELKQAKVADWETLELDQEALRKERAQELRALTTQQRRLRALAGQGDAEDASDGEEDLEELLTKAAAPQEKIAMNLFQPKDRPEPSAPPWMETPSGGPDGAGQSKAEFGRGRSTVGELARGKSTMGAELGGGETKALGNDLGRGKSRVGDELGRGQSNAELGRGKSTIGAELGRGKSTIGAELGRGKSTIGAELGRGKSTIGAELGRGKSTIGAELGRGKSTMGAELGRGKSTMGAELGRGESKAELGRGKSVGDLGRGKSKEGDDELGRGASSARSKFGQQVARGSASGAQRAALEAAQAAVAAAQEVLEAQATPEEVEPPPEPYQGQVFAGMPVIPRGLGTPRREMLAGEVYRSSLDAPMVENENGLQWGHFSQAKPHYRSKEELQRPPEPSFLARLFGVRRPDPEAPPISPPADADTDADADADAPRASRLRRVLRVLRPGAALGALRALRRWRPRPRLRHWLRVLRRRLRWRRRRKAVEAPPAEAGNP